MSFWQAHGILFLAFMFFFPRLTLLLSSVPFGGLLWWLGWFIAPRLLVAVLATTAYWTTDTLLVIITWIWALSLESGEKGLIARSRGKRFPIQMRWNRRQSTSGKKRHKHEGDVIDV